MAAYPLCPSCKAPLSDLASAERPRCRACGAEVHFPGRSPGPVDRSLGWGWAARLSIIVGAAVLLSAGILAWKLLSPPATYQCAYPGRPFRKPAPPVSTVTSSNAGSLDSWANVFPVVGPFFGEGREDLLGLMRDARAESGSLVALDGEDFHVRWSSPVGAYAGLWATQLAVVGQLGAWAQSDGVVHVMELATGRAVRTIRIDDGAGGLCPHPTENGRALYVGSHGLRASIDLEAGTTTGDTGVVQCPFRDEHGARAVTAPAALPPAPEGTEFEALPQIHARHLRALADGSLGVAVATKRPGFPLPSMVGFGLADRKVRWSTTLGKAGTPAPSVHRFDVGKGQVVVLLNGGTAARLAAMDAETGALQWETPVPCEADAFRLGSTRIYAMGKVQLHIFDRRSGRLLHSIGNLFEPFCR